MGHMAKHCPLYGNTRAHRGQQDNKLPDIPHSGMAGHMAMVHKGKQVVKEKGCILPRKVAKPRFSMVLPAHLQVEVPFRIDLTSFRKWNPRKAK